MEQNLDENHQSSVIAQVTNSVVLKFCCVVAVVNETYSQKCNLLNNKQLYQPRTCPLNRWAKEVSISLKN